MAHPVANPAANPEDAVPMDLIGPSKEPSQIAKFLAANSQLNIWKWNLRTQDEVFYPAEKEFLEGLGFFNEPGTVLDLSWGKGFPVISRVDKFAAHQVTELGVSYEYIFSGSAKAKRILADIESALGKSPQKFNWIRVYLVVQMIRHHGVFLEGLGKYLLDGGVLLIFDTRDEYIDFHPTQVYMRDLYDRLGTYQQTVDGIRDAAERIKKRAADHGFRLMDSRNIRIQTQNQTERDRFFRMYSIHADQLSRWFPNKFEPERIMEDVKRWHGDPKCWGSMGLQCLALQKRSRLGRRRGSRI